MSIFDLLVLALASRAILDVWLDEDSILLEWRAATQEWRSKFWSTLLNCRFCLSYWVPQISVVALFAISVTLSDPWSLAAKLPAYGLAATGLIRLLDQLVNRESLGAHTESNDASRTGHGADARTDGQDDAADLR